MKSISLTLPVLFVLFLAACKKENVSPHSVQNANPVRFDNPEVGQSSRYVRFKDSNANDDDNSFDFLKDTLMLEIVASDSNGFKVKESLTPGSQCLTELPVVCDTAAIFYYFKIENDTVLLYDPIEPAACCPMIFWQSFQLPLTVADHLFTVNQWKLEAPATVENCPESGRVENFTQFGMDYGTLKVASTLYCNRAWDGNDYTYVYSASKGIVRYYEIGSWFPQASGWYLLN